jgi:hypothetical protein
MPAGSIVVIFDESCGFAPIFCAIGFGLVVVVGVVVVPLPDVVVEAAVLCVLPCVGVVVVVVVTCEWPSCIDEGSCVVFEAPWTVVDGACAPVDGA